MSRSSWLIIRAPLAPRRATVIKACSFLLPFGIWAIVCAVWNPDVFVIEQGNTLYKPPLTVNRKEFEEENARVTAIVQARLTDKSMTELRAEGKVPEDVLKDIEGLKSTATAQLNFYGKDNFFGEQGLGADYEKEPLVRYREIIWDHMEKEHRHPAVGELSSPYWLPAPWKVAKAFYNAFLTEPVKGEPWLHQSLWHSCQIIFWGFILSAIIGVPLGILCGTFDLFAKLTEPFIDFIRYMPAPAFGVLCIAILGLDEGPKIAIIWIGTFFQMVLVVANTTRQFDESLLEAAQTLGATKRTLLTKVILPGILPALYNDMRILIGWAWTYLIVAELIGASSGISHFINHHGKHQHFDKVYAGIIMIGIIGLTVDQFLSAVAGFLFPWVPRGKGSGAWAAFFNFLTLFPRWATGRPSSEATSAPVPAPNP